MTYVEAIAYLEQCASFGIKPGLERIERLLQALGNPEKAYKVVHVTGTNGKGSVTSFIASVLTCSGHKVGRYTSPHLVSYTERFCVNGEAISEMQFADLVARLEPVVARLVAEGMESPTQFEILTALGFLYFKEVGVDYAVIEVGLGGLLDSTNVVNPSVSVITNVAIDHQDYCGRTIPEIARHKAGIIKSRRPVVTTATGVALEIIKEKAALESAPLYAVDTERVIQSVEPTTEGQIVRIRDFDNHLETYETALRGAHQSRNLACALGALWVLAKEDSSITKETILKGIKMTRWPGRFEVVQTLDRLFILDGAHNTDGAKAFEETYETWYHNRPKALVMAILKDKDVQAMIGHIVKPQDRVITVPAPTPRSSEPEELAQQMPVKSWAAESVAAGLEKAMKETQPNDIIVVAGSLYILGEVKEWLSATLSKVQ
ncbi:folylpolyglutamate synthase/dihydrofolate synthase family protein [uncultured Veillonella sp.]|uniref:bifunctional folylpolyglutamate synthase/dihydrofolate synthase n=1 Tax=uncultured Veillonella sp. TaxID=159268 RepID=UPI0025F54D13|nr:folylpolyglutamate synthase/dihydrofolate synthase family protein [uncultured Veillonella sp.]MDY3973524.1 folylpolyglutamate synthase/dihydrofolate synthase family protein [Veillonella caviae]